MKKAKFLLMVMMVVFLVSACGLLPAHENSSSLNDIQNVVRETQAAFENNDYNGTQNGISKLLELSKDSLYSENERLIAQFCATYINAGVMLDYIIKNDKQWLSSHNIDEFDVFYRGMFVEIINGQVTHTESLKEYIKGLVRSTQEIYSRYSELTGK